MANVVGKLAEAYTANAATPNTHITDLGFSYPNPDAQEEDLYELTPDSGGWHITTEQHYANDSPSTLTLPSGVSAITYGLDGEGRANSVNSGSSPLVYPYDATNHPHGAVYTALGLAGIEFGSGDYDTFNYDAATGAVSQYQFTLNGQTDTGTVGWNPNGSAGALTIADNITGTADSQSCSYAHDDLGRLANVNCTQGATQLWQQTFTIDPFGNVSKSAGTGQSFSANFNLDNRISSGTNYTPQYDSDGHLTDDPVNGNSNAFDADGHAVTFEGVSMDYDAFGRAVQADGLDGLVEFVYSPAGRKIAVMNGGSLVRADVPLPGGAEASFGASGLTYYAHADWLGSSRLQTKPDGSLWWADAIAPYGEAYNADAAQYFTGMQQDVATNNYDFLQREYNTIQGRWWTPDPAGLAAVDPNNPQSWNRYTCVLNSPLEYTDPTGLKTDFPCGNTDQYSCVAQNAGTAPCPWWQFWCGGGGSSGGGGTSDAGGSWGPSNDMLPYQQTWVNDSSGSGGGGGGAISASAIIPNNGPPWYQNACITSAIGKGAAEAGVDSIGLIPEAGGVARIIGHQAGYVGVVADHFGANFLNAVGHTASVAQGLEGLADSSPTGLLSTGLTVAGFIPGLNDVAAVGSIGVDIFKTVEAISQCH